MQNIDPTASARADGPNSGLSDAEAAVNADIEALSQQLAQAESAVADMRDVLLRERAELENQRRRLQRDLEQARRFANERLLSDLLPVCDSLERGLAIETADSAALREGMDLTLKTLNKVVEANGLKAVDPVGQPFNPELHQAMSMIDSPDHASGTVVSTMQKGYVLNERLLRPALVAVAK
ncbi:nucleotide exchange factor GrpE [Tahibacter amnicola]|uniref:Protein GrpE n=1 Tax=Tahibacter amnicola TaxID=2976241 RepID=A0ABY6BA56_9GAMM|nr:nucleotide exchange factor GrpE [Tahibacter amnicola]UXI66421.1 nucleotide exchange factor GrpE [Tahibacter amnicola]